MERSERLETMYDVQYHLEEAVSYLKAVGNYEDAIEALADIIFDVKTDAAELESEVAAEQAAEDRAMEREYWQSVL